jgi:hypothetical protein
MTDMLMAGNANQGTLANIAPGSLVLAYGYSFPGLPGFVIQGEKGVNEVFMMEGPRWGAAALDSRTPVISHGQAIARSAGISREQARQLATRRMAMSRKRNPAEFASGHVGAVSGARTSDVRKRSRRRSGRDRTSDFDVVGAICGPRRSRRSWLLDPGAGCRRGRRHGVRCVHHQRIGETATD